jgi:hypothetical protein
VVIGPDKAEVLAVENWIYQSEPCKKLNLITWLMVFGFSISSNFTFLVKVIWNERGTARGHTRCLLFGRLRFSSSWRCWSLCSQGCCRYLPLPCLGVGNRLLSSQAFPNFRIS